MQSVFQTGALAVVGGLLYGCTLLLVATGLTLIFGVGRVVNVAHGTLYALGAFLGASIHAFAGLLVACLVAPALVALVAVALVAVALDLGVIRRLRRQSEMTVLLFTFGLGIVIDAAITGIWGARSYAVPVPDLFAGGVPLFGGQLSVYAIALAAISVASTGLLVVVLHRTRFGLRLRAAAENPAMAEIAGVDVDRAFTVVLAVGSAFAALAGVLVLPMIGASNGMDLTVTALVFIVVIVGGLGSLLGATLASLLVGVILTLGATYASSAAYLLLFAAVIGMLLVRPFGLAPSRSE